MSRRVPSLPALPALQATMAIGRRAGARLGLGHARRPPRALFGMLVLVGFLLVVTGTATTAAERDLAPRKQAVIRQILQQRRDVGDLDQAVDEVRQQVVEAHAVAGRASAEAEEQNRRNAELSLAAGTTALEGPGTVIELSDAERSEDVDEARFDESRIQDRDLQLVVNALFAIGAEAVAINESRVAAVTPIRAAGGTIVVNYRPVSSPYRIVAIGVDEDAFSDTPVAGQLRQWRREFDLGFEVDGRRKVSVPAYSGRVGIDIAREAEPSADPGRSSDEDGAAAPTSRSRGRR